MNRMLALAAAVALGSGVIAIDAAEASTTNCDSYDLTLVDDVSTASDCEISDVSNQDFVGGGSLTVNEDMFFGTNDWMFIGKIGTDDDDGTDLSSGAGTGTGQSGTYSLSSFIDDTMYQVMLIFKDGSENVDDCLLPFLCRDQGAAQLPIIGFLLDGLDGDWTSPFADPPFTGLGDKVKDVSHISVYVREVEMPPIPLPASGFLMLGALGGVLLLKRRRKA